MNILISGGCKNGKSSYAQNISISLAEKTSQVSDEKIGKSPSLIYFATMIPHDGEDCARIQKHRCDRKDLGFQTVECGKNISETAKKLEKGCIILFDSLTALVANEMFDGRTDFHFSKTEEDRIIRKLQEELEMLMKQASSVIFVSDTIFNDGKIYDETTELYRKILSISEQFIAKKSDTVVEMACKLQIKNEKIKNEDLESNCEKIAGDTKITEYKRHKNSYSNLHLIIGGAYQGKTVWAKSTFMLEEEEIFACSTDSPPDFSKKCITHYENYVAFCLKHGVTPKTDFLSETKDILTKIIICDDIFCGVVPIDPFQRTLREETGLALQKIAENSSVTRIFCGIPQKIQ